MASKDIIEICSKEVSEMSITDFQAAQKWSKLPRNTQQLLLNNVFCSACGVTTIVEYTLHNDKFGILLKVNVRNVVKTLQGWLRMNKNNSGNKALLVIDIQEDATGKTASKPYENSKELIDNVNSVINNSEKKGITVIYIKHEIISNFLNGIMMRNKFIKGTPGSEIDSRIKIINNYIFSKDKGDALSNLELDGFLKRNNINELFMVGLDAAACVYKTSIGAISRGYKTVVLKDAIVTSNMGEMPKILDKYKKRGILLTSIAEFKEIN